MLKWCEWGFIAWRLGFKFNFINIYMFTHLSLASILCISSADGRTLITLVSTSSSSLKLIISSLSNIGLLFLLRLLDEELEDLFWGLSSCTSSITSVGENPSADPSSSISSNVLCMKQSNRYSYSIQLKTAPQPTHNSCDELRRSLHQQQMRHITCSIHSNQSETFQILGKLSHKILVLFTSRVHTKSVFSSCQRKSSIFQLMRTIAFKLCRAIPRTY